MLHVLYVTKGVSSKNVNFYKQNIYKDVSSSYMYRE
jgi:hypothetical protein